MGHPVHSLAVSYLILSHFPFQEFEFDEFLCKGLKSFIQNLAREEYMCSLMEREGRGNLFNTLLAAIEPKKTTTTTAATTAAATTTAATTAADTTAATTAEATTASS